MTLKERSLIVTCFVFLMAVLIVVLGVEKERQVNNIRQEMKKLSIAYYAEVDKTIKQPMRENQIEVDGDLLRVTFRRQDFSMVRLKRKKLTWEEFKDTPKSELVVDRFEGGVSGIEVLILSPRKDSELLP